MSNYEIIKFVDGDFELDVNISPQQNTIWLTQDQIAKLFENLVQQLLNILTIFFPKENYLK